MYCDLADDGDESLKHECKYWKLELGITVSIGNIVRWVVLAFDLSDF